MSTAAPETNGSPAKDLFTIKGTHHLEFFVGNAKQAAYFYRRAFGFELFAYSGPETGVREACSYALRQGKIVLVLTTPLIANHQANDFMRNHGDGVRDIAMHVEDAEEAFRITTERGAKAVAAPHVIEDKHGKVKLATIATYGDTVHTFVERGSDYTGPFLPHFEARDDKGMGKSVGLQFVDHVVGNVSWDEMNNTVEFYKNVFGFSRFVSFDDKDISTEYTALRSTVVANENRWIKFPINEPAEGLRKSQIEEYVEFNNGPGVQHIAMHTNDIISTVAALRENGVDFLETPDTYYTELKERVGDIDEDVERLRSLKILVDRDDKGYMLQLFTKPLEDRPTLFIEIIQRRGAESFGKGNFKALFESIEREQGLRGNL